VAKWSVASSISRRISLLVALIVIGVLTSVAYLQTRSFQQAVDRDLVNAARLGAQSVADDLAAREGAIDRSTCGTCSTTCGRGAVDRCHRGDRGRRHGAASGRGQHVTGAGRSCQPGREASKKAAASLRSSGRLRSPCRCPSAGDSGGRAPVWRACFRRANMV
jgi:hypothetical protein